MIGTLGNTLLEWYRASLKNRHDALALRKGLAEELRQALNWTMANIDRCADVPQGQSLLIPVNDKFPIYEMGISKIGLLKPKEIELTVRAYGMLQAEGEKLSAIARFHKNEIGIAYAIVNSEWGAALADANRQVADALEEAIACLSGKVVRPAPAAFPAKS
ncbi:hypothetical protein [Sphingomonas sp. IW22]|uniref:hypothetical protein n=1 Tax=Sphingomonas sp. IW22 TaxID=3242489 RepID=UPI003520725A